MDLSKGGLIALRKRLQVSGSVPFIFVSYSKNVNPRRMRERKEYIFAEEKTSAISIKEDLWK